MKLITAFTATVLLSFLLASGAQALENRAVAKQALTAHAKVWQKFKNSPVPQSFVDSYKREGACLEDISDGIASSPVSSDEKFGMGSYMFFIFITNSSVDSSKLNPKTTRSAIQFLNKKSSQLLQKTKTKGGRLIALSLKRHAAYLNSSLNGKQIDFCQFKDAISGNYTGANFDKALESVAPPGYDEWVSGLVSSNNIFQGSAWRVMAKMRPRFSEKRLNLYTNPPSWGVFENSAFVGFIIDEKIAKARVALTQGLSPAP